MSEEIPKDLASYPYDKITQGYISITESTEVRIRMKGNSYYLTVKTGDGLLRKETEVELSKSQFEKLRPLTKGMRLEKKDLKSLITN